MNSGSAVTSAIAYVVFNRNRDLVNHSDTYESLFQAINPDMANDGIKHVIEIADSFYAGVKQVSRK